MSLSEAIQPENFLDMEAVVISDSEFPIETFSRDHDLLIPALLTIWSDKVGILYYFSSARVKGNRDMEIFLNRYGARQTNEIYTLYASSSQYPQANVLRKIIEVPSTVNYASYVWQGKHYFHFAFRHEYLREISNIILSPDNPYGIQVGRLAPNNRMMQVLKWLHDNLRLSMVSIESIPPEQELSEQNNPMGSEWIREIKCRSPDGKIKAVYHAAGTPSVRDVKKIAESIYEIETQNELISFLSSKENHVMIPEFRRLQKLEDGKFTITVVLPEAYSAEYIRKLARASIALPQWKIFLSGVTPLFPV